MSQKPAPKCPECGYSVESREHLEGLNGVHEGRSPMVQRPPLDEMFETAPAVAVEAGDAPAPASGSLHVCPVPGCLETAETAMKLGRHTKKVHGMSLAEARSGAA